MAKTNSLDGKLVTIVGGSGFFGTHVAEALLERGARLRIASRNPEKAFRLKPLANLGQIQFTRCDVSAPESMTEALRNSYAVIYMVGAFSGDLITLHTRAAEQAARIAASQGTDAFIYISGLGAKLDSESDYARTKAMGEQAVLSAFPKATVLRPAALFGEEDDFVQMFAKLVAHLPILPVFGSEAELQPLWVNDAAEAAANALEDPAAFGGRTYEIAGPDVFSMGGLHKRLAQAQRRSRTFLPMPDWISAIFAALPGTPINSDQWLLLSEGSKLSGELPGIEKLGVSPHPLDLFLDRWMMRYRKHGRFAAKNDDA